MVHTTRALHKIRYQMMKKNAFTKRGVYRVLDMPFFLKQSLKAQNVNVVDAYKDVTIREKPWTPAEVPKEIPPDFRNTWAEEPEKEVKEPTELNYWLNNSIKFSEGLKQACLLTKTQRISACPPQIKEITEHIEKMEFYQDESTQVGLYQLGILQSQIWDPSEVKLPRHKDQEHMGWVFRRDYGIPNSKSAKILLDQLIYIANTYLSKTYPEVVTDRKMVYKPEVQMAYDYQGSTIIIKTINEALCCGAEPLQPFLSESRVKASTNYTIPTMDPVLPTIDLEETDRTISETMGAFSDLHGLRCSHPLTIFRITGDCSHRDKQMAHNLMLTFAAAAAEAKQRYGITDGELPMPVTIQNISMTFNRINFIYYQLNTLDTSTLDGIKNFAWTSSMPMFKKVHPQPWKEKNRKYQPIYYTDLNMEPFKQFLATYINGAKEKIIQSEPSEQEKDSNSSSEENTNEETEMTFTQAK